MAFDGPLNPQVAMHMLLQRSRMQVIYPGTNRSQRCLPNRFTTCGTSYSPEQSFDVSRNGGLVFKVGRVKSPRRHHRSKIISVIFDDPWPSLSSLLIFPCLSNQPARRARNSPINEMYAALGDHIKPKIVHPIAKIRIDLPF